MAQDLIDQAVFVSVETGWDLDYVLEMPTSRLNIVIDSIFWQVRQREYRENYRAALIASTIHNVNAKKTKRITPEDIIGDPPERQYKPKIKDKWKQSRSEALANFYKAIQRGKEGKQNGSSRRGIHETHPPNQRSGG